MSITMKYVNISNLYLWKQLSKMQPHRNKLPANYIPGSFLVCKTLGLLNILYITGKRLKLECCKDYTSRAINYWYLIHYRWGVRSIMIIDLAIMYKIQKVQ